MNIGLLLLRTVIGLTLAAHGSQKLFGWFGGPGLEKAGAGMQKMGFGSPAALLAGLAETGGGLFLALGLATPAAAAVCFAVMLVAGASVHFKNGFFLAKSGYEFNLVLGIPALSVAFTGPGSLSIDALLGLDRAGAFWGLAALLVGLAGAGVQLALRKTAPAAQPAAAGTSPQKATA
jgi:putative oxidoreductase